MLIRQACGVKKTHPFDDFPHYSESPRRKSSTPAPSQVRANFSAYMEAMKAHGQKT